MIATDTHLAIVLAGLAAGETLCEHVLADDGCGALLGAIEALGARVRRQRNGTIAIAGVGNGCLLQPEAPLALNSPGDALCVAGLVAPYDMSTRVECAGGFDGDARAALLGAFAAMGIQAGADGGNAIAFSGQSTANPAAHDAHDWSDPVVAAIVLAALGTPGISRIDRLPRDPMALVETFTRFGVSISTSATDNCWSLAIIGQIDLHSSDRARLAGVRA